MKEETGLDIKNLKYKGNMIIEYPNRILDFDMVSKIITFEENGRFGKEKHQNLGVKVKVVA